MRMGKVLVTILILTGLLLLAIPAAAAPSDCTHDYSGGVCTLCGKSVLGAEWLAPSFASGDYSVVLIPDTQNLVENMPEVYYEAMQWIADNQSAYNIKAALHVGDMVNANTDAQWAIAKEGIDVLDEAGIAWMPMRGNHDASDYFNSYFDYATYGEAREWFGGSYDHETLDSTYWFFSEGKREYMVLSLGWAPEWEVLDWAGELIERHDDKTVLICLHAYVDYDGFPLQPDDLGSVNSYAGFEGYPEGQDIWDFFREYKNVAFMVSGHVSANNPVIYQGVNAFDKKIVSMLVDSQTMDLTDPLGMVALLTFHKGSDTVSLNWYSTRYDAMYGPDNQRDIIIPHVHNHEYLPHVIEPTCTEAGYTLYKCACGNSYTTDITDALDHDVVTDESVKATCTEGGLTEGSHCARCGEVFQAQQETAPLGHKEVTDRAKLPTCTEPGLTQGSHCRVCGEVITAQEEVPATGHMEELESGVPPTCTKDGLSDGIHCFVCGEVLKVQEPLPATGHSWDEGVVSKEPTEDTEGVKTYTCSACGETRTESIPTLDHEHHYEMIMVQGPTCTEEGYTVYTCRCGDSYHDDVTPARGHEYQKYVTPPTCEKPGYTTFICYCGDSYPGEELPATGHFWQEGAVTVEPTEESEGLITFVCTVCGETREEVLPKLEHMHRYEKVVTPADCENDGYTTYICACGFRFEDDHVPAFGHEYVSTITPPTCTEEGYSTYVCHCGDTFVDDRKPALGHMEETNPAVEPTCTEKGKTEGKHCTVCNAVLVAQKEIAALGHTEVTDKAVAPTCTETGLTEGKHCAACDIVLVAQQTVPALGHTWDAGVITKAPTEKETGIRTHTCTACGKQKTVELPTIEHVHSYTDTVTEPDCVNRGYTTHTCSGCGDSYQDSYVDAKGHEEVTDKAVEATCTEDGLTEGKHCAVCDTVLIPQQKIAAKGHEEVIDEAVEATCTEDGLTEGKHCAACDIVLVAQEIIPATGHSWDEGVITTEPTEETEGVKTFTCASCGEKRTESLPTLEHTHSYTAVITEPTCEESGFTTYTCACGDSYKANYIDALGHEEVTDKAVEATCTEDGLTEGKHCAACDTVLVAQETIPATGHSWDEGVITTEPTEEAEGVRTFTCVSCGEKKTESIPALEHTHNYIPQLVAPTCTAKGYTAYTCNCGESYQADFVPALGHSFGLWQIETESVLEGSQGVKYRMCACGQRETASYSNPLIDVPNGKYFTKPIFWAYENGITKGKTATEFKRDAECTRKQIVTFLWRAAGQPEPKSMVNPFSDVKRGDQFEKAILWAYYEGITSGTGDGTTFSPENVCTRKQIVTFLWRFYGQPAPVNTDIRFTDVKNDRFAPAILWAAENGITTGTGDGSTFSPENTCTRGQIVTFLYRAMVESQQK